MLCPGSKAVPTWNPPVKLFSFSFSAPQINCVTFPHPDTMPEQQLLKPTEWSYCDYFWVGAASVSLHGGPADQECLPARGRRHGPFLLKPEGVAVSQFGIRDRNLDPSAIQVIL
jgi:hypothetical protein